MKIGGGSPWQIFSQNIEGSWAAQSQMADRTGHLRVANQVCQRSQKIHRNSKNTKQAYISDEIVHFILKYNSL